MKTSTTENVLFQPIYDLYLAAYLRAGANLPLLELRFATGDGNRVEFCFEAHEDVIGPAIRDYFNRRASVDAKTYAEEIASLKTQLYTMKEMRRTGGNGEHENERTGHARD